MSNSDGTVVRGVLWSVGTYALSIMIRFGSSVILSRLLTPELLGIWLIIHTVRHGIELSSDLGFGQNIVVNKAGATPEFFNTVWVLQIFRGLIVGAGLFVCAAPIAGLYGVPTAAFQISGAIALVSGLASTSIFLVHRKMQLAKLNLFDLAQEGAGAIVVIAAALVSPTIESLLMAALGTQLIRTLSSYFLTNDGNRLRFNRRYALEILTFGRWIVLSSILSFLCANFDRLYIGMVAPFAVLGVYGIARSLADVPGVLAARVGYSVVFPTTSQASNLARPALRAQLSAIRFKLLLGAAAGVAFAISISDLAVTFIYDGRYHEAGWMLQLLLFGVWLAVLCSINEYALLGFGKPSYSVMGNAVKLAFYLIVLPQAYQKMGILGAIFAIVLSEVGRYIVICIGQWREQFSFLKQDAAATLIFLALIAAIAWGRSVAGFGSILRAVPIDHIG